MQRIRIGQSRGHEPMQVVSGRMDYPTVHFEAPRDGLEQRLDEFIQWFNSSKTIPCLTHSFERALFICGL